MKVLKGFKFAYKGIVYCIEHERNMRVHIVATILVLIFSSFFNLSCERYVLLFLTISMVISAEMINTAIERLVDLSTKRYNVLAKISKDVAAGAVLVCAVFAVVIGIFIFWDLNGFMNIYNFFSGHILIFLLFILMLYEMFVFIKNGPVKIINLYTIFATKFKSKIK